MLRILFGHPAALNKPRQIAAYLMVSPLICLTSASLSVGSLWLLAIISSQAVPDNWLHWWVGDWFGLLLGLPLMLVVCGEPRALWRHRSAPLTLLTLTCFAVFAGAFVHSPTWPVIMLGLVTTACLEAVFLFVTGRSFEEQAADRAS